MKLQANASLLDEAARQHRSLIERAKATRWEDVAAVLNIGFATLGALIGAGGFGQPILTGINRLDYGLITQGAIAAALMAIAAWLVWREGGFDKHRGVLNLFIIQLIPNVLWSWLFFSLNKGGLAFADIILLWVLIAATIISFWRVNRLAGAMLIPYLLWVSFAAFLNYSVWQLNPQILG